MSEFWERFAFYGTRWALVLSIVAQFHGGHQSGQADANLTYGCYLALVYAGAIFGGYLADRIIGYQRAVLIGAGFMAAGLFVIMLPNPILFKLGLATIIVGNGLFKPNISTMVGKLYSPADQRRDSGFTIFYMGINMGAFIAPIITGWLANSLFGTNTSAGRRRKRRVATRRSMSLSAHCAGSRWYMRCLHSAHKRYSTC